MITRSRFDFLDALRGFAAIYVVVYHAKLLLWIDSGVLAAQGEVLILLERAVGMTLPLFSFGRQMVLFFFVLSGFVIHFRYARELRDHPQGARFDLLPYLWRRARRIYPPLLFALALTFALDRTGMAAGWLTYANDGTYFLGAAQHDLTTLIGNLLFVMTVYVPAWGTNSPLWSLMLEWWFYLFYPLFWLIGKRSMLLATGVLIGLFGWSISTPLVWYTGLLQIVFASMICWWMGALLADIYLGRVRFPLWKIGLLAPLVIPLLPTGLIGLWGVQFALHDLAWAIAFSGVIAALLVWDRHGRSLRWLTWLTPTAAFSYTLYVTHMPILALFTGWLGATFTDGAPANSALGVFVVTLIALGVAWAAHFIVEKPFMRAGKRQPKLSGDLPTPSG